MKRNGIGYFIGNPTEIPTIFVFSLIRSGSEFRQALQPRDRRSDFWECQEIPITENDNRILETFRDSNSAMYLPSGSFHNQDQPSGTRLLYVDVDRTVVPEIYHDLENYLLERMFELGAVLNGNLCYQSFLDYLYRQIRDVRDDYYAARTSRRARSATILRLSADIEELLYWYSRYSQEYTTSDLRRARHLGFPEMRTPPLKDERTIDYLEFLGRVTTQTKTSLEKMTTFHHSSITRYRELSMLRSNTRLQRLVIVLTVATVILGISQVLGLDLLLSLARELARLVGGWISHL